MAFSDHFYNAQDGLRLHYRRYAPEGETSVTPALCLPGLTRNARDFHELAQWIADKGRAAYALDLRGRGDSEWAQSADDYVWPVYARDLECFFDALDLDGAVFIGTSLGGILTMLTAVTTPHRVKAAILNDVGPELNPAGLTRLAEYAGHAPEWVKTWSDAADYAASINQIAFPRYTPSDWAAFAKRLFRENEAGAPVLDYDPSIGCAMRGAGEPQPIWAAFEALNAIPTLAVRGETSDILSADTLAEMQTRKPDLKTAIASGVGHAPMLDEPEARAAIAQFLDGLDPS